MIVRFLIVSLLFVVSNSGIFAQARLVLNGATMNIANGGVLVINNPAANAITRTSGYIISEGQSNIVKWNIGTTTGNYVIPWGDASSNYIPVSFTNTAGIGAGSFLFSTYPTPSLNSSLLPSGVTNFNTGTGADNSNYATDRFWQVNATGYTTKPGLTNLLLTYKDADFAAPNATSVEGSLTAERWNDVSTTWLDYVPSGTVNVVANTVTLPSISATNLYPWWAVTYAPDRHWIAAVPSNWNNAANWSYSAGGAGGVSVPATIDDVLFDAINSNMTLDISPTMSSLTMKSGYTGILTQGAQTLTINNGATLSGGTFSGGSAAITILGPFTLSGTSFTSTTGTLDLKKAFTFTSGSFAHNNGTVQLSGTSAVTQNIGGSAVANFNNINITNTTANPGVSVESNQNLKGILTLASNVIMDADGSTNNSIFKLISSADGPTQDASIAPLPSGARVNGSVTAQRYMSIEGRSNTRIYRYISSPVQNATVADIQNEIPVTGSFTGTSVCSGCGVLQSMFAYNESVITDTNGNAIADFNDGYIDFPSVANTETLQAGKGYTLFVRGDRLSTALWDVRGPINAGNVTPISFPVTFTSSGTIANDGWNFVGNPFPSTINWNAAGGWTKANLDGTVYVSDNGSFIALQYTTWNGTVGTNGGTTNIAMGQGFWVKATGAAPVLQANENVKAAGTQTVFFRTAGPQNILRVTMVSGITRDETVVHFREDATELFDSQADAWKLMNGTFNLSSSLADGNKLAINSLPLLNCGRIVPLSVDNATAGSYILKFSEFESFPDNVAISLTDKFTNTTTEIRSTSNYNFSVTSNALSYGDNRFSINFGLPAPQSDFALSTAEECSTGASIQITNSQPGASYVALLNNKVISPPVDGNGGVINLLVQADSLQVGLNSVSVQSIVGGCSQFVEKTIAVHLTKKYEASILKAGQHCREGQVTLTASGAPEGGSYNWYESEAATLPVENQHDASFVTGVLLKSKTYYVAIPNGLGCEGKRLAVMAEIVLFDDAKIAEKGNILSSNFIDGNQWSFDNVAVAGETGQSITAEKSGNYSVSVAINGCTTSASREFVVTGLKKYEGAITAFPNPVIDEFEVEIPEDFKDPVVKVINSLGQVMGYIGVHHEGGKVTGKFQMKSYPSGVYVLQVAGTDGVVEIKLMKQ